MSFKKHNVTGIKPTKKRSRLESRYNRNYWRLDQESNQGHTDFQRFRAKITTSSMSNQE